MNWYFICLQVLLCLNIFSNFELFTIHREWYVHTFVLISVLNLYCM